MKVLVINCGSSSLKYQLIDSDTEELLAKGLCERIAVDGRLTHTTTGKEKYTKDLPMPDHNAAVSYVLEAADIIKIAMFRVNMELKKRGLKSRLILQIHDELLVETAKDEVDIVKEIMEKEMMGAADMAVPLEIGISEGDNWYDAK